MMVMIFIINWPVAIDLVSFNWDGGVALNPVDNPHGGEGYLPLYLTFMAMLCVFPYMEEMLRCWRHRPAADRGQAAA